MRLINRLWFRLMLAFVATTLVTVTLVSLIAGNRAGGEFREYLNRRELQSLDSWMQDLSAYYQKTRSWDGVSAYLTSLIGGSSSTGRGRGAGMGQGQGMGMGRPSLLVADASGRIIFDEYDPDVARSLTDDERANALPIQVQGQTVGYFGMTTSRMMPAEQNFLSRLQESLTLAAIIAAIVGAGLGLLISRSLTAPLSNLTRTAHAFATHKWDHRAEARGATEIAEVGKAFNTMADELSHAETLRRNLMADIAHELRTPLSVMQGNLSAMLDGVYAIERSEIASLYDETRLLLRLVNDLRELALADAGQIPFRTEEIETGEFLHKTCEKFVPAADAQGTKLTLDAPADLPSVTGDPDRLSQVMHNLIANALRHSQGNAVTVQGVREADRIVIAVVDTGEGIPEDELPHVFERFYRGDRSRARATGGSGLGLAIARAWVLAMHGEIGVESQVGSGSRFWFALPIAKAT